MKPAILAAASARSWAAAKQQEERDTRLAVLMSLESSAELRRQARLSMCRLALRLTASGLRRIDTEALGNCMFESLCRTGGLPTSPYDLRQQVVEYMKGFPTLFGQAWDGFPDFDSYLRHMANDGSWGDHLCMTAAAHLLWRPIRIITDSTHEESGLIEVAPPLLISPNTWGPPLYLVHYGERHYEATAPKVPVVPPVKSERGNDDEAQVG